MPSKKKTANKTYKNGKQPRKYNKTRPQREVSAEGGEFGWRQQQWSLEQVARNTGRSKNDTKGPQRSEYQVTFVSGGFLYNESSNVHVATEVTLLPAVISKDHEKRIGAINEGLYNQRRSGKTSQVQLGTGTISSISDDMKHATCHSNESQSIASDEDIVVFAGRSGKKTMIAESPSTFIGSSAYHPRSRNRGSTDVVRQPPNRTRRGSRSPGNVQWNQYTWGVTSMREGLSLSESDEEIVRSTSTDDEAIRDYMENIAEHLSSTNSDREEKMHSPSTHTSNKRSFALDQASDRSKTAISKVTPNSHDYSRTLTKHQDTLSVTSSDTADQAAYDLQAAIDTLDGGSDTNSWADNVQYPGFLPIADRDDDCGYSQGELDQPKNDNDSIQRQDETDSAGAEWIQTLPNRTCVKQSRQNFVRNSILDQEVDQVESTTFDIMDRSNLKDKFERPRRSPQFDLELSDSELEQVLRASWEADKLKKKTRKKEREEARAKGLIGPQKSRRGGSTGIDDLDWSSMKSKITDFLMSNQQMLALPAMDKRSRQLLHQFANAFGVRSKSTGNGAHRFPTLYRTSQMRDFESLSYEEVEAIVTQRLKVFGKSLQWRSTSRTGTAARKGAAFSATYRDGDIVGAQAPEIGSGNRGRAMLEKMGWSSGTALGSSKNKGILQPLSHTVKNSRVGLGH